MPIERISADLRRIRARALAQAEGMPLVQRRAILAAYDDALMDACRALGVDTELDAMNDDLERESERLRTEVQLERSGIVLG
jgi:DNA-binding transcriptional MerR regulator